MSLRRYLAQFFRDLRHPRDIYGCFLLFFKVAFLFGLTPFHVNEKRELSICVFGCMTMIARLVVFDCCFVYNYLQERSMVSYFFQTNVSQVTASSQKFAGMLAMNFVIGICFIKRRLFKDLIVQFENLEYRFPNVGIEMNQLNAAVRINVVVILLLVLNYVFVYWTLFGILGKNGCHISTTTAISFYSPNYIASGLLMLFYGTLFKINAYFRALNKALKILRHQWERNDLKIASAVQTTFKKFNSFSMFTIVAKSPSEIVQESMEIHQLICKAADTANKYFTYQLLTVISVAFLIIVFDYYYVLETLLGKSKWDSKFSIVEFISFFSIQLVLYIIITVSIIESSNRVINKSQKTGGIVHELLNKTTHPEIKEKLQQFSMQLMHLKVNFTAAGLFNVDRSLYFTMYGALTTYLIILLQVSEGTQVDDIRGNERLVVNMSGINIFS